MRFYTECLLSKWGFEDGDMLCDFVVDNETGFMDHHDLLIKTVREKILPKIKNSIEVCDFSTCHNPIRAEIVDGVRVNSLDFNITLQPEFVDVSEEYLLSAAKQLHGERD